MIPSKAVQVIINDEPRLGCVEAGIASRQRQCTHYVTSSFVSHWCLRCMNGFCMVAINDKEKAK
jgi:hypothetical protein